MKMRQLTSAALPAALVALLAGTAPAARASEAEFQNKLAEIRVDVLRLEGASGVSWRRASPTVTDQNSSWEAIRMDWRVRPLFPQIQFGSTFISVDQVCRDGETLRRRSKEPLEECVRYDEPRWGGSEGGHTCVETRRVDPILPISGNLRRCAQWHYEGGSEGGATCVTPGLDSYPLSYQVGVVSNRVQRGGEFDERILFTKPYHIEICPKQ